MTFSTLFFCEGKCTDLIQTTRTVPLVDRWWPALPPCAIQRAPRPPARRPQRLFSRCSASGRRRIAAYVQVEGRGGGGVNPGAAQLAGAREGGGTGLGPALRFWGLGAK